MGMSAQFFRSRCRSCATPSPSCSSGMRSRPEILLSHVRHLHQSFSCGDRVMWTTSPSTTSSVVGSLSRDIAELCIAHGQFIIVHDTDTDGDGGDVLTSAIRLRCDAADVAVEPAAARTAAVAAVTAMLRGEGMITGWRDEMYDVVARYDDPEAYCKIERAAAPIFGTKSYGVHVNGFVRDDDGDNGRLAALWIARRSMTKQTYPGCLDHVVAGGLTSGLDPLECLVKECAEEANVPEAIARRAMPAGAVSYTSVTDGGRGLKRDVLFVYDLFLPRDFVPENVDGEVESFELWPIERVVDALLSSAEAIGSDASARERFKPNVALVIIDALLRHGVITPEERGYLSLLDSMRQGECF